jgi:hypothetical protein
MRRRALRRHGRGLACLGLALLTAPPRAATAAEGGAPIPPGRERQLAEMLGAGETLPGGCRFDGGTNAAIVTAQYACGDRRLVVQLRDPDDAPVDAPHTAHFAVVVQRGAAPPGFLDALAARIHAREDALVARRGGIPPAARGILLAGLAIPLATACVQMALERRRRRRAPPPGRAAAPAARRRTRRAALLAMRAVVLVYLGTRLPYLRQLPVFIDEAVHIQWAHGPFGTYFLSAIDAGKLLPLQWLSVFAWLPLEPLAAARLASVAIGLATLVACMCIDRELFGTAEAVLAGFVYTILPFALFYDRLALADVYVSAGAAWALYWALAMRRRAGAAPPIALGLCLSATMLAKPTGAMFLVIPLLVACLLVGRDVRRDYLRRALPALIGGAALLGVLLANGYGSRLVAAQSSLVVGAAPARLAGNLWRMGALPAPLLTPAITWLTAAALPWAVVRWRRGDAAEAFLLALLALAVVPYALVSTVWFPRYLLFAAVPVALLAGRMLAVAAAAVAALVTRRWRPAGRRLRLAAAATAAAGMAVAAAPYDLPLVTDPARAALPAIERALYVSGWTSGYGLPELADFLRQQARQAPVNVVRLDQQSPANQGIDVYLAGGDGLHKHTVDPRPEIAAAQLRNLARRRRTLLVLDPSATEAPPLSTGVLGDATNVWSYRRPGDETWLEVWEVRAPS